MGLVLCDGGKVTGVTDDGLEGVSDVFRIVVMVEGRMVGRKSDGGVD